jgi:hypothetical protein
MFEINKWDDRFETAHTRKRQRLGWYLAPSGNDSKGYRKLMRNGKDGILALGVFAALCQHTATLSKDLRGRLCNSDGSAMDIEDISEITRMKVADIRHAGGMLVACGWLTYMDKGICQDVPPICQPSANFPQGEEEGEGEGKGKATAKAEEIYSHYPKKAGKKAAIKSIENALKIITPEDLLPIVETYGRKTAWMDKQYIPNPATWFNQERWEDDQSLWEKPKQQTEEITYGV